MTVIRGEAALARLLLTLIAVTALFVALAALCGTGCHKPTPPEEYIDRPSCLADSAAVCVLHYSVADGMRCTDGNGDICARCYPTDPALDWCILDGARMQNGVQGATAADWVTCVSDCRMCTPKEALAVDPEAYCAVDSPSTGAGDM